MAGKQNLPYDLENLSLPELEALLQKDFIASNGGTPDVDYIMAIAEVMQEKAQEQPDYQPLDTEKAWEEFQSFYNAEGGSIYESGDQEEIEFLNPQSSVPTQKKPNKVRRRLLAAALIAALVAVTMIPVSGYANVLQMVIAYWTDDYFSFAPGGRTAEDPALKDTPIVPVGFEPLWDFAQEHDMQDLAIPWYIPDGFEVSDTSLDTFDLTDGFRFSVFYTRNDDYIGIDITKNYGTAGIIYEKDKNEVEPFELNGVEYFIFNNNGENASTIYLDGMEYVFGTTLPKDELKQIIDSIHGE